MSRFLTWLRARLGWLLALAAVALVTAGYLVYRDYQADQAQAQALGTLRTEVVARGDVAYTVSATGLLFPKQQSNLAFLVPGTVAEVLVEAGDAVRAGQVLARLDVTALRLAVQQAEDALRVAELDRRKLLAGPDEGDIAVAKANLRSANAAVSALLRGAGPEEVNIAQLQYDAARSGYQSAADQYNLTVEAAAKEPETAPSQDVLDRLKLSMETAYYAAEIGRLQLELAKNGADKGSLSVAYARVAQAKAALEQLQAPFTDLQTQQADLAVTQAQLALDQARLRASWAELTAPFDGVVATVNVKVGEPAAGSAPAVVLIDPAHYYLDVAVNEIDVAQLAAGQAAAVSVDALSGRQLTGTVQSLAPVPTAGGNPVNYVVRIVLEPLAATPGQPAAPRLRSGMSALAQIAVAEARDVLLAPNWSIRRDRRTGQAYASLKVGDQVTEVPITTGLRGDQYTEVTSGLQEGDTVAVGTQSTVPFDAGE